MEINVCVSPGEELRQRQRVQKKEPTQRTKAKKVTSRFVVKLLWETVARQNHTSVQIIGIKPAAPAVCTLLSVGAVGVWSWTVG